MDPELDQVVAHERLLLDPEVRADPDAVLALLHHDFTEFGASGTTWGRRSIVAALADETAEHIEVVDVRPTRLAPDVVLLTYTARGRGSASRRTSIWLRNGDTWQLRHHQGTRFPEA